VFSSMRLGVPFIAPRQLGAVESIPGRQILPSAAWRTGQSGAHRTLSGAHRTLYKESGTVIALALYTTISGLCGFSS
jgi:hypothetical protein